ncbi:hypothetical protein, partial [Sphingomonas sp. BE138]|uniref:hypothetical protein n=1 Tax=Sphingomonas sp. BE138 TaxID=2817845 RepID=UPI00286C1EA0
CSSEKRLFLTRLLLPGADSTSKRGSQRGAGHSQVDDIWHTVRYETAGEDFVDDDDYQRVGYFYRKYTRPVALIGIATEGLVEDFFSAWSSEDEEGFDPDSDTQLLLYLL